jgi:hypothetical protein
MQNEYIRTVPVVTHLAARRFILTDVLVTKEAVVRHTQRVARLGRRGDSPHPRHERAVKADARMAETETRNTPAERLKFLLDHRGDGVHTSR